MTFSDSKEPTLTPYSTAGQELPPFATASPIAVVNATNVTYLEEGVEANTRPPPSAPMNRYANDDYIHPSQRSAYQRRNDNTNESNEDPETILGGLFIKRQFCWPSEHFTSTSEWVALVMGFLIILGGFVATLYIFLSFVVLDHNGNVKPFKGLCTTPNDMRDNLCYFSVGQISYGIISLGQVNIGLICIGQVSIGLLCALGQAGVGWGYSIGQIALGTYVKFGQICFALYRIGCCQWGLQCFACFFDKIQEYDNKPIQNCEKNGCVKRR